MFLKISTQLWRYAGKYEYLGTKKDKRSLEKAKAEIGRDDVAAVISFQKVTQ